jgi:uncharacterized protein (DUF1501 family)
VIGTRPAKETAIAMAQNTPLVLRGVNPVSSWAPSQLPDANEETLRRIQSLYANDEFFSSRLQKALGSQEIAGDMGTSTRRGNRRKLATEVTRAAARFLSATNGPRMAVLESSGWDTHANQGAASGSLANRLGDLDNSLQELRTHLGETWESTTVVVVTEFGRTVRVNGTRGTDHGTAGAALLLGGAVKGGRVVSDWPGLQISALYEGRDLYPTTDIRSIFKAVLAEQWHVPSSALERDIFPDSRSAMPLQNLFRV